MLEGQESCWSLHRLWSSSSMSWSPLSQILPSEQKPMSSSCSRALGKAVSEQRTCALPSPPNQTCLWSHSSVPIQQGWCFVREERSKTGGANVNQQMEVERPVWHWGTAQFMSMCTCCSLSPWAPCACCFTLGWPGESEGFSWCYLEKEDSLPCGFTQL